ncbi:MAG: sigma-70 family RNA polymerase sigma factor [Lentisphaeraceae bacterium]|nr:sigma-70 family RNA polymerase sigma factor [Lentisphaeraceae bacterium]
MSKDKERKLDHTAKVQELFVEHVAGLRYFVMSLLPDPDEAQDVIQETFITITAKANDFKEGSNFRAWAYTIARFKVLEVFKKSKREANRLSEAAINILANEAEDLDVDNPKTEALNSCLQKLSEKTATMIELRYKDGLKPSKIAERIGWTAEAVYVALSRTRTSLKNCIQKQLKVSEG